MGKLAVNKWDGREKDANALIRKVSRYTRPVGAAWLNPVIVIYFSITPAPSDKNVHVHWVW